MRLLLYLGYLLSASALQETLCVNTKPGITLNAATQSLKAKMTLCRMDATFNKIKLVFPPKFSEYDISNSTATVTGIDGAFTVSSNKTSGGLLVAVVTSDGTFTAMTDKSANEDGKPVQVVLDNVKNIPASTQANYKRSSKVFYSAVSKPPPPPGQQCLNHGVLFPEGSCCCKPSKKCLFQLGPGGGWRNGNIYYPINTNPTGVYTGHLLEKFFMTQYQKAEGRDQEDGRDVYESCDGTMYAWHTDIYDEWANNFYWRFDDDVANIGSVLSGGSGPTGDKIRVLSDAQVPWEIGYKGYFLNTLDWTLQSGYSGLNALGMGVINVTAYVPE